MGVQVRSRSQICNDRWSEPCLSSTVGRRVPALTSLQLSDLQSGGINKLFVDVRAVGQGCGRSLAASGACLAGGLLPLTRPSKLDESAR
jgi:hypothetical protein